MQLLLSQAFLNKTGMYFHGLQSCVAAGFAMVTMTLWTQPSRLSALCNLSKLTVMLKLGSNGAIYP